MKKAAVLVVYLVEVVAALYVALMTGMLSAWFLDDGLAFSLSTLDWYRIGGVRFVEAIAAAIVLSLAILGLNALLGRMFPAERVASDYLLAVLAGLLVCVAGLAGSIYFVVEKPFI